VNLPLAAVLLLYIALPGIVVRRSYLSGPFSRSYLRLTLTDETVYSLGLALPFHGVGLLVSNLVFDRTLDLQGLAHLMTGSSERTARGFLPSWPG
jgi:hypothetical protein